MVSPQKIAIVGMAGRFPGARNIDQFWANLRDGVESIRTLTDVELLEAGVSKAEIDHPDYVKRASQLVDIPLFDGSFFGLSPRDAAIMDPQHRHFLETAWEALEDAAHPPRRFDGSIGLFAGSGMNAYLIHNLLANRALVESAGMFQLKQTGNDKDVLATRVSYQFDLRGPSINVQTACSTSLVAVHMACQSLLNYECDLALAGGVTIEIPYGRGYLYKEGEIFSRDGRCRSFDAGATGTVFGSGAGVVVLRRLEDALADRDNIRAVILGSAINNDGARKVGYLAPSVDGQAEVIAEALAFAGVGADDISYVEAHGTGTVVGDPIEVRALTQAFRKTSERKAYCRIGTVKSNIGHLDAAAGIAGLIKTVLALQHENIPPSLHFTNPNPHIDFEDSPFLVNDTLTDWSSGDAPRRAGVTSLGIGGTNAHVVLESAPSVPLTASERPFHLLTVSAKTARGAQLAGARLFAHLCASPEISLADASFTCRLGRDQFPYRMAWAVENSREALKEIAERNFSEQVPTLARKSPAVVFMFSGQGSQYVNMGGELYEHQKVFRDELDLCAELLRKPLGIDLRGVLFPPEDNAGHAREIVSQTWFTQPALFAVEYALAHWWMSIGVVPAAMVGHSIGEYVAACLAGVFTLEEALETVTIRGRLMFNLPAGAMLAVSLRESEIELSGNLSLAAVNCPAQCVVSGPGDELAEFEARMQALGVHCKRLETSHAFHSAMMEPILDTFEEHLRGLQLKAPQVPFLSNLTGTWITPEQATDPAYWASHLRHTVRFFDCLAAFGPGTEQIFLEVGPGTVLTALAQQQAEDGWTTVHSLPHPRETVGALGCALGSLGTLWTLGVAVDWTAFDSDSPARRVSLPTYPFEHSRFWVDPDEKTADGPSVTIALDTTKSAGGTHFYRRAWKASPLGPVSGIRTGTWAVFKDSVGLGDRIIAILESAGAKVLSVESGPSYSRKSDSTYGIRPTVRADYDLFFAEHVEDLRVPLRVIHLWPFLPDDVTRNLKDVVDLSFVSPMLLAQSLAAQGLANVEIALVSNGLMQVFDEPVRNPARAVMLGPAKVIPLELPGVTCRSIDLDSDPAKALENAARIAEESQRGGQDATIAYRGSKRFLENVEPFEFSLEQGTQVLEKGGVYLITGGTGGLGLVIAEELAREYGAHLVLLSRSKIPPDSEWEAFTQDKNLEGWKRRRVKKLIKIRTLAGGLLVIQGDVTNLEQVRNAVTLAAKTFGRIDGVFHAAGVLDDGPLMLKTPEQTAQVMDAKVRGTLVLEKALRDMPLRFLVLFSSISSVYPAAGQIDYAAANAFLDAFALSRAGVVRVINWDAWQEVGMAARPQTPHPFLQMSLRKTADEIVYESSWAIEDLWALDEHHLKTPDGMIALLPGTGYMEMAAAAFARGMRGRTFELRDVFFLVPLAIKEDERRTVQVQLKRTLEEGGSRGSFRFAVVSAGSAPTEHCIGIIAPGHARSEQIDREAIALRCGEREIGFDEERRTRQERQFVFGPRWRSLVKIQMGKEEALAEIELNAAYSEDIPLFQLHPALLDLATGAAFYLTESYEDSGDLFLPISYKRLVVSGSLPAHLFSHIRGRNSEGRQSDIETFDVTIFDIEGKVLVEIEGFAARRVKSAAQAVMPGPIRSDGKEAAAEGLVEVYEDNRISPEEGVRALFRIVNGNAPRSMIVMARPLTQADPRRVPTREPIRPVASDGAIPGQTIEDTLASWWRDMLGVDQVELDDDFFSLGGHSLTGVRLLVKIKKVFHVDLDMKVLFESSTVRRLSSVIRDAEPTMREK